MISSLISKLLTSYKWTYIQQQNDRMIKQDQYSMSNRDGFLMVKDFRIKNNNIYKTKKNDGYYSDGL
jgi:hypothetical protein